MGCRARRSGEHLIIRLRRFSRGLLGGLAVEDWRERGCCSSGMTGLRKVMTSSCRMRQGRRVARGTPGGGHCGGSPGCTS